MTWFGTHMFRQTRKKVKAATVKDWFISWLTPRKAMTVVYEQNAIWNIYPAVSSNWVYIP